MSIRARRIPLKSRKLLVIDDDTKLLMSYRDLLSPYGFEVLTAPDGQDAIPLVELAMPRMDGREWLRWFRSLRRDSPVIIITAYKVDSDEDELKPAVILEKPFHVAELLDLVGLFCGLGTPMEPAKA